MLTQTAAQAQPADFIITNAKVITQDSQSRIVDTLAVRGNLIIHAGTASAAQIHTGPATRIIDAGGRTVIPGLIDSHIHAIRAGLTFPSEISFAGARTVAEAMARIRHAAQRLPSDRWIIVAGGWTEEQFAERRAPTLAEVEAAAPGHAVYLQIFYRAALLNERAREKLGINSEQDIPPAGVIERDPEGRSTGWIRGDQATIARLYERLPQPDQTSHMEGTQAFFAELNAYGVTGVIDPGGLNLKWADYEPLFSLWRARRLNLRVAYSLSAQPEMRDRELAAFEQAVKSAPTGKGADLLRFNGIGEIVTWGMYNNEHPSPDDIANFETVALWAARQGLTVTTHWNRNASILHLLGALERVNAQHSIAPLRWSVAHIHDASIDTLRRLHALRAGWLMQNAVFFAAPSFLQQRGESLRLTPPLKSALELGLPTGAGTDAHRVMWYNPFVALQWMVDGRTVAGAPTRSEEQKLSRLEALAFYTKGSAWFTFDENNRGRLEAGTWADLAILSGDYLAVPVEQISSLHAMLTMVDGRIVHALLPFK